MLLFKRLFLLAGLSLFALSAGAQNTEWEAKCQAEFDRRTETLEPVGPPIDEPERPNARDVIAEEARSIREEARACKAKTDDTERAACRQVIRERTRANRDKALEARLLERRGSVVVSERAFDKRRVEGMAGPLSIHARRDREAARLARDSLMAQWSAAELDKEMCLASAPVPAVNGKCSPWMQEGWSGARKTPEGKSISPDLCFPMRPEAPQRQKSVMTTHRAFAFRPGQPIRVAFNGGTPAMRNAIQTVAQNWAEAANGPVGYSPEGFPIYDDRNLASPLVFDFGRQTPRGFEHNTWTHNDTEFAAEIRISFYDGLGYWSLIGTEGTDPGIAHPGEASMNLEGMHGYSKLPADWKAIVFHEFGHALGLQHEHQHPISECGSALRLEDDPGYVLSLDSAEAAVPDSAGRRPGVLTLLEHAPNFWSREEAQFNLGQLKNSGQFDTTPFDPDSIMRYEFDAEWYRDDAPQECLPTGKPITKPSKTDYAMVAKTYRRMMLRATP